jgi:hypothetical protein
MSFASNSETTGAVEVIEVLGGGVEAVVADVVAGAGAGKGGRSERVVSWLSTMIKATAAAAQSEVQPQARRRMRLRPRRMMSCAVNGSGRSRSSAAARNSSDRSRVTIGRLRSQKAALEK